MEKIIELPDLQEKAHIAINARGKKFEQACQELLSALYEYRRPAQDIDLAKYRLKAPWDK